MKALNHEERGEERLVSVFQYLEIEAKLVVKEQMGGSSPVAPEDVRIQKYLHLDQPRFEKWSGIDERSSAVGSSAHLRASESE